MTVSAIVAFVIADVVRWAGYLRTLAGSMAGSYMGAQWAQRLNQRLVKGFVVVLGTGLIIHSSGGAPRSRYGTDRYYPAYGAGDLGVSSAPGREFHAASGG